MSRIFVDSNILIYHFEDSGTLGFRATEILRRIGQRGDDLMASTLAIGEVLVKPIEYGNAVLEAKYRALLRGPLVGLAPFDAVAGELFARVRQDRRIRTPDAIHLACAGSAGCDLFITNDERLSTALVPGIKFIVSMDRAPI
jgi:predicted nucleic acid-binding protein